MVLFLVAAAGLGGDRGTPTAVARGGKGSRIKARPINLNILLRSWVWRAPSPFPRLAPPPSLFKVREGAAEEEEEKAPPEEPAAGAGGGKRECFGAGAESKHAAAASPWAAARERERERRRSLPLSIDKSRAGEGRSLPSSGRRSGKESGGGGGGEAARKSQPECPSPLPPSLGATSSFWEGEIHGVQGPKTGCGPFCLSQVSRGASTCVFLSTAFFFCVCVFCFELKELRAANYLR